MNARRAQPRPAVYRDGLMPERIWQRQVRDLAGLLGWACYHTWLSIHSDAGFPDLVLAKPGQPLIFAELKRQSGRLTQVQRDWITILEAVPGVRVFVWKPSDWETVQAVLDGRA